MNFEVQQRDSKAAPAQSPIAGRRALVMGLGAFGGGLGTARWLAEEGAQVTVTDLSDAATLAESLEALSDLDIRFVLGEHRAETFEEADLVVANPAVNPGSPWLEVARKGGAEVTSEVTLFLERVPGRVLAITGTQGKSSTASMTHQLLAGAGISTCCGGNIGGSLLCSLASIKDEDIVVLELSSYQLEALPQRDWPTRVVAVAITNVLADHLERHGNRQDYCAAKTRVLELIRNGGTALLPAGDKRLVNSVRQAGLERRVRYHALKAGNDMPGLFIENGRFRCGEDSLGSVQDLAVPGSFQVANALLALGLAFRCGISPGDLSALVPKLSGLSHRMQDLGLRGGIRVIDNAVSTTPDSTEAVLGDVPEGSCILLGGKAKQLPWDSLVRTVAARELRPYVFGEAREYLQDAFAAKGVCARGYPTLEEATGAALSQAERGSTLLFSPACASFDAFTNFRERAEVFLGLLPPLDRLETQTAASS